MVDRALLRKWFEDKGMLSARSELPPDSKPRYVDAANCNARVSDALTRCKTSISPPGRSASDLWPRVQDLVTELHAVNPEMYNNAMASEIYERLCTEFPEQKILALSTIKGNMKEFRETARALHKEENPGDDF